MPENPDVTVRLDLRADEFAASARRLARRLRDPDHVPGQLELPFDDDDPAAA